MNTQKTKVRYCRLLRYLAWKRSETILAKWEETEKQENR